MDNHTFVTARFTNNDRTTIQARWQDNEDETVFRNSYVEVDENNLHYKNLLELISEDQLHENTVMVWRQEREQYDQLLVNIAKKTGDWIDVNDDSKFLERLVVLLAKTESEISNEEIFKFKLAVFDHPKVADSKDRKLKASLRKAKTYIEIVQLLSEF
tara:strand:+ start:1677 stop:2150 length:474 start_codon:yes stop_codon:yes gene_type:complete